MRLIQYLLLPFSLCYGFVMMIRNLLFDLKILRSESFSVPVISVGNLSMGGTGKTPVTEYIIRLLQDGHFVATLSRGYKRESKGFILADRKSSVKYIGDEPMQYLRKFEKIKVAVDEKRTRGIRNLLEKFSDLECIVLDDAFQHRYVKPGLSILLTDYHQLYTTDHVLPAGNLREFRCAANRADIIIVTKTPKIFSPITKRRILEDLKPKPHQKVFFSYIRYLDPVPAFDDSTFPFPGKTSFILLFTGIANDYPLREHLERFCSELKTLRFPDHHKYDLTDLENICKAYEDLPTQKKIIVTTEKDMMRLKTGEPGNFFRNLPLFYLRIEVDFHDKDKTAFDKAILGYVTENKRNR
jgi:tetraacyldisaccharide 4'-kinase